MPVVSLEAADAQRVVIPMDHAVKDRMVPLHLVVIKGPEGPARFMIMGSLSERNLVGEAEYERRQTNARRLSAALFRSRLLEEQIKKSPGYAERKY